MAGLAPLPKFTASSADGAPLSGGKLFTYAAGTSTPLATYTDHTGNVANANPVVLDSRGEAAVWLGEHLYKLVLKDALDNVVWTVDYVCANSTTSGIATATYATLRTFSNFAPDYVYLKGRSSTGDGGQGMFYLDPSDTTTADNGCTVLVTLSGDRYKRLHNGPAQLEWVADAAGAVDGTAAIQAVLNAFPDVEGTGNFLCGGLTVPASLRSLNINGTLLANANGTTVLQFTTDVTRQRIKRIGRLAVENNGKTGVTGVAFGSVTNNPSAGAKESVLYVQADSIYVKGCETGMRHDVTMEHDFRQTVLIQNTVGLKLYADTTNGGGNANSFGSLRLQGNAVGAIVRNTSPYPMHNNQFGSLILQENTVCGIAFVNCVGQNITSVHIEGNGSGAASVTVDGYVIAKSDILLDNAEVTVVGADLASSLNPCVAATNGSKFIACGFTGYGSSSGNKVSCDATSLYYEDGPVAGIGITNNHASYGVLTSVQGLAFATGTPLTVLSTGQNLYNSNPLYPDLTNAVGVSSSASVVSDYGPTPEVTFAASIGSTATNRIYMSLMTCVASTINVTSLLIKSNKTSNVTIHFFAGAQQLPKTITLSTGWTRIVFISANAANHQVYIYPADAAAPAIQVQAVQCTSDTLATASEIYQTGKVCIPPLLYGSATYDPPNLADGAGATATVTVTGAALGDFVTDVSFSLDLQGITTTAWVSAANTVSVRFQNESGGAIDLASGTLRVRVEKKRV